MVRKYVKMIEKKRKEKRYNYYCSYDVQQFTFITVKITFLPIVDFSMLELIFQFNDFSAIEMKENEMKTKV